MTTITRFRGDTRADIINVINKSTKTAVDVTGGTFRLTVDPEENPVSAANNLFSLTGVILDPVAGKVSFTPTAAQADQVPDTYFFDIQFTDAVGTIETLGKDKYIFTQDVSK
jgi:hypothetical protein